MSESFEYTCLLAGLSLGSFLFFSFLFDICYLSFALSPGGFLFFFLTYLLFFFLLIFVIYVFLLFSPVGFLYFAALLHYTTNLFFFYCLTILYFYISIYNSFIFPCLFWLYDLSTLEVVYRWNVYYAPSGECKIPRGRLFLITLFNWILPFFLPFLCIVNLIYSIVLYIN